MDATEILAQAGGIQAVAQQLGISEAQAASGAAALLPAILGGFKNQAQSGTPAGPEGLGGLLTQLGGGAPLDNVVGPQPTHVSTGNHILGQIFGSRDVSRAVAQDASAKSGLSPELLKRMLPLLAMLATGYLAKQHAGGSAAPAGQGGLGGLGDVLGGLLGGRGGAARGPGSMLDLDGDGNALNDLLKMAGKAPR